MSKEIVQKGEIKSLARPTDPLIFFHPDLANKTEYLLSEIERLETIIKQKDEINDQLKSAINDLADRKQQLDNYRRLFFIRCIISYKDISIFQCAKLIEETECTFYPRCNPRIKLLKRLKLIT